MDTHFNRITQTRFQLQLRTIENNYKYILLFALDVDFETMLTRGLKLLNITSKSEKNCIEKLFSLKYPLN